MKIRKGDNVRIISGNDRGKTGSVRAAFPFLRRIVVEGVNVKKKHVRPRKAGQKGALVRVPLPFPVSRAMLVCAGCGKAMRPVMRAEGDVKQRVCRVCGKTV